MFSLEGERYCKRDRQAGKDRAILLEQHRLPCAKEISRQRELVLAFPCCTLPHPSTALRGKFPLCAKV